VRSDRTEGDLIDPNAKSSGGGTQSVTRKPAAPKSGGGGGERASYPCGEGIRTKVGKGGGVEVVCKRESTETAGWT